MAGALTYTSYYTISSIKARNLLFWCPRAQLIPISMVGEHKYLLPLVVDWVDISGFNSKATQLNIV